MMSKLEFSFAPGKHYVYSCELQEHFHSRIEVIFVPASNGLTEDEKWNQVGQTLWHI